MKCATPTLKNGDVSDGLKRLKLFAYSLGPTDESMALIVIVWGWEKINKQRIGGYPSITPSLTRGPGASQAPYFFISRGLAGGEP
jgi:hypothetical protein